MPAESEMVVIIQAAPTAWIRPPKFDARLAIQIARKVSCLKGARGEAWSGTRLSLVIYGMAERRLSFGAAYANGKPSQSGCAAKALLPEASRKAAPARMA